MAFSCGRFRRVFCVMLLFKSLVQENSVFFNFSIDTLNEVIVLHQLFNIDCYTCKIYQDLSLVYRCILHNENKIRDLYKKLNCIRCFKNDFYISIINVNKSHSDGYKSVDREAHDVQIDK